MSCETFKPHRFGEEATARIAQCNTIIEEYQAQGLRLTLRQLYYQCVSRDLIPNNDRSYKNLGGLLSDARLAGLVDWDAIEDRGRQPHVPSEWDDIESLVDSALRAFRLPRWQGQQHYVELWVEKEALAGVLEPLAREFHVTLMVNKGYSSSSAMYAAAQRFLAEDRDGLLFYLGDHDPSGEDMVRDIDERLQLFGATVTVKKLALTMAQIRQYNPPPNPTKLTDARARAYIAQHGRSCWEVDALPPNVLAALIRTAFRSCIDSARLAKIVKEEDRLKAGLKKAAGRL